ncbi:MAG: UvrD-helicase domain-containing protein [Ilumatobacteraceae bacterium]
MPPVADALDDRGRRAPIQPSRHAGSPSPASVAAGVVAGLDPAQAAAVTTPSTLVAVIAGAGSGKTRVLTTRIAHRIDIGTATARHTLALTFTREAAGELRRRVRRSGVRDHVETGTFHSVALALLRQRWADVGQRPPTVVGDRERLIAEAAGGVPVRVLVTEAEWAAARGVAAGDYVHAARAAGRRRSAPPGEIAAALGAYETLKRRRGVVDLDDLLALAERELSRDVAWADAVRFRYRHVLVDEAQDLNPLQHRLLDLIDGGRGDLYLVGDPAQAIYGFNGSDPELLRDVASRMPGVEVIHLPVNHRCSPQIVNAAVAVLRAGGQDSEAVSNRGDGPAVRIVAADDEDHEAALVARFVRSLEPVAIRTGAVAVLARTNAQLGRLSAALTAAGITVTRRQLPPGSPIAAAARTATALPSASRLRAWAHDVLDADVAVGIPVGSPERQVAAAVLEFLRDQPFGDGAALRGWLASTNPFADPDGVRGVEVLTFHAAKGREWPTVVVTGVETGLVPHRTATTGDARAEETRLLHVAMTRASDTLVLTWAARRGGYRRKPSPLLDGVDTDHAAARAPTTVPAGLRSMRPTGGARHQRLVVWRDGVARAAMILPEEVCSDGDLEAIVTADPASADDLVTATRFGPLTASRLFPGIRAALDG